MRTCDIAYSIIIILSLTANAWSYALENPDIRYIQYIGLFAGPIFCWLYGFKKLYIVPSYIKSYILLIVYGIISCLDYAPEKTHYIVFWSSSVLLFLPYNKFKINLKIINIIFAISQFCIISDMHLDLTWMAFLKSTISSVERNAPAFVFPLFLVYFLYKSDKWMCALNTIGIIIFGKRIIIVAFIGVLILYIGRKYFWKNKQPSIHPLVFVGANMIYLYMTILFANREFNHFLQQITGLSIGELTMGRNQLYKLVVTDFSKSDLIQYLFGHGIMSEQSIYCNLNITNDVHNDILKIAYEYGIICFCVFFLLII